MLAIQKNCFKKKNFDFSESLANAFRIGIVLSYPEVSLNSVTGIIKSTRFNYCRDPGICTKDFFAAGEASDPPF